MPSPEPIPRDPRGLAASAFARSLTLLLKYARLYGFEHARVATQFEATWRELQSTLQADGSAGFLLGVASHHLLLDGVPLDSGTAERGFAQLLSTAGVTSIHFSFRTTAADFEQFVRVFATAKPAELCRQWNAAMAATPQPAIRLNEVRFVAQDSSLPESHATHLAARALGEDAGGLQPWLADPQKLIQLIAAAEGAQRGGVNVAITPEESAGEAQEDDVVGALRLLVRIADPAIASGDTRPLEEQLAELAPAAQVTLQQALASLAAAHPEAKADASTLLDLAEHLAIRFALDRYQRGEVRVNAVRELLDRLGREIGTLRKVLAAYEQKMSRAGLVVESHADLLDSEFWKNVPESGKQAVLTSPDAWCIPPRNIASFLEELQARNDLRLPAAILSNYAGCIHDPDPEARRKTALGLNELAGFYARVQPELLGVAVRAVANQMPREIDEGLQQLMAATFVRLSHEAAGFRNYSALRMSLATLDNLRTSHPELVRSLRPRLGLESRLPLYVEETLRAKRVSRDLAEVLQYSPRAAARHLAERVERCASRAQCNCLTELASELGQEALDHLRDTLRSRPAHEAASVVGLLTRLDPWLVAEVLPGRLREWDRSYQDLVVRQIAAAGAPQRGRLLLQLLSALDPVLLPQALDEIGLSRDPEAAPGLMQLIRSNLIPYLQVKAVEALGRLRAPGVEATLKELAESRHMLRWTHPREVRVAALQALIRMEPRWAENFFVQSGLTMDELEMAPLKAAVSDWARQRRYPRVIPLRPYRGLATTPRRNASLLVESLSLGGGLALTDSPSQPCGEAGLELKCGLRPIRAQVLVRPAGNKQVSFEFVNMELKELQRLRGMLAREVRTSGARLSA